MAFWNNGKVSGQSLGCHIFLRGQSPWCGAGTTGPQREGPWGLRECSR